MHPMEASASSCSHRQDPHHILLCGDGVRHALPPSSLGPRGGGPRRDGGGADGRSKVAARTVEEDEDPSAGRDPGVEVDPGWMP